MVLGIPIVLSLLTTRVSSHFLPHAERFAASFRAAAAVETKTQTPHGDMLVNLLVSESEAQSEVDACTKTIELSDRNACDVELLTVG